MAGVRRIGLVLCPDFDFMGLAVTSPFAVANRYVADTTYDIHVLSEAGGLLRSGSGPAVETEPLSEPSAFDTIIVAAGISLPEPSPDLVAYLREAARSTRRLAGLCLGAFALADAGLLSGRRATTHWRYAPQFRARYPTAPSTLTRYTSRTATSGLPPACRRASISPSPWSSATTAGRWPAPWRGASSWSAVAPGARPSTRPCSISMRRATGSRASSPMRARTCGVR